MADTQSDIRVQWNLIKLMCGDCGSEMQIVPGDYGCFYSCATYPKCRNRMSDRIFETVILDKLTELLNNTPENTTLTGYRWHHKKGRQHFRFKVVKQLPNQFVVEVINVKKSRRSSFSE